MDYRKDRIVNVKKLNELVNEGWLKVQKHPMLDLMIWNYSERTQFEKHWTPETVACRGLITDSAGIIVSKPPKKFFNWGEVPVDEAMMKLPVLVTEKIDRSLGILYPTPSGPAFATRGSFTSDHCVWANKWMEQRPEFAEWAAKAVASENKTPVFEIMCPKQQEHTVDYGGYEGLCYLGHNSWGTDRDMFSRADQYSSAALPPGCMVLRSDTYPSLESWVARFETLDKRIGDGASIEGYVAQLADGTLVKFKLGAYKRLSKLISGLNENAVWEALASGTFEELVNGIPDEYMDWAKEVCAEMRGKFDEINKSAEDLSLLGKPLWSSDRKSAYLAMSKASTGSLGVVLSSAIARLDGRDCSNAIWRAIKPKHALIENI
jgi:RNA ligase